MEAHNDCSTRFAGSVISARLDRLAELLARQPDERQRQLLETLFMAEKTLVLQLKQAIESSGRTAYSLGKEAGIRPEIITRFLNGERDLRLETAGKICAVLGLALDSKSSTRTEKG
jgi:DNA-binding phage protein